MLPFFAGAYTVVVFMFPQYYLPFILATVSGFAIGRGIRLLKSKIKKGLLITLSVITVSVLCIIAFEPLIRITWPEKSIAVDNNIKVVPEIPSNFLEIESAIKN